MNKSQNKGSALTNIMQGRPTEVAQNLERHTLAMPSVDISLSHMHLPMAKLVMLLTCVRILMSSCLSVILPGDQKLMKTMLNG